MKNKILLGIILLLGLVNAAPLMNTQIGNYSFTYSQNHILGERINLAISNNNSLLVNGFSCNTFTQKDLSVIENNFENSIKSGYAQGQINVPININDKYQLYNTYNVTVLCVSNQYPENATLDYLIYIEPNSSFNLWINFQLWLVQNGFMLILGTLFMLIVFSVGIFFSGLSK
jgi:hypothetical protein